MTVSTSYAPDVYAGNGATHVFPFTFRILLAAHLVVVVTSALGVDTTLVQDVDYTVTWAGPGEAGSINRIRYVLGSPEDYPPATGEVITLSRGIPLTQDLDLRRGGAFGADVVERALDKHIMLAQQLKDDIDRVATQIGSVPSVDSISGAMQPVVGAATLPIARQNLGTTAEAIAMALVFG